MKSLNLSERLYIPKEELKELEFNFIRQRHIERYAHVRQFAKGKVLDVGCGCGYGTFLVGCNPEVENIIGYDHDKDTVAFARGEYSEDKVQFVDSLKGVDNIDMIIAIEVMEHIEDVNTIPNIADSVGAKKAVVSYPTKKTTHYNPYHCHDFEMNDILTAFDGWEVVNCMDLWNECRLVVLERG